VAAKGYVLVRDGADLQAVAQALDETDLVGVDTETTGLDPRTDRLRLIQLATDRGVFLVDCFAVDPAPLWPALADRALVAHNAIFDMQFLAGRGFTPAGPAHDTQHLSQLLHGTRKGKGGFHGLAAVTGRELGRTMDKAEQKSNWAGGLTPAQLAYAAADAAVLPELYTALAAKVKAVGLEKVAGIESRCLPAVAWMARSGVPFDRAAWERLATSAKARADAIADMLDAEGPWRPGHLSKEGAWNWDSPSQAAEALALLGEQLESTDDDALAAYGHPFAALLREYRAANKLATTYGADFLKHVAPDGRIYPSWRQIGSDAGRMSCSSPNMQQLPREKAYRRCVRAPEGRVLVKADYSQIELRIGAKVSGDAAMLAAYGRGDDLHTATARSVLGVAEVTKEHRQTAKSLNFGLVYGMGAAGFCRYAKSNYGVELTEDQAKEYRAAFFRGYPGLAAWHRKVRHAHASETRTLAGRRRLLRDDEPYTFRLNSPVQGTGSDGLKMALALLWERRADGPGAFPVLAVHDEIVVECDAGRSGEAAAWLKRAMLDGMAPLVEPVPVEVEVKAGPTWARD
jgi:DNA polymerase-1